MMEKENINLRFAKVSDRWYVDIPYDGSIEDLEMVSGADTFLDCYAKGRKEVRVTYCYDGNEIVTGTPNVEMVTLEKVNELEDYGATYKVDSNHYRSELWLCPVCKLVLGEYPEKMKIAVWL